MADTLDYDKKIREMQKYIPFLETLIKKMKNNKDEKRETHLQKVEMLYGLLTNKDKKLKIETLQKCEAVLVKLCNKIEKGDGTQQSTSASTSANITSSSDVSMIVPPASTLTPPPPDLAVHIDESSQDYVDIAAPASPTNNEPHVEYRNPIVIPTERRRTPPPPTGNVQNFVSNRFNTKHNDDRMLFDRVRPRDGGYEHNRNMGQGGPELFRRRSPNRDRSSHYDEEVWRKYDSPTDRYNSSYNAPSRGSTYSSDEYSTPKPRQQTVRTGFSTEVLKSPPLTMDDLKDLMNDPEQASGPAPVPPPVPPPQMGIPIHVTGPAPVPAPIGRSPLPIPIHIGRPPGPVPTHIGRPPGSVPAPTGRPSVPVPVQIPPQMNIPIHVSAPTARPDPRVDHSKDPRFAQRPDPRNNFQQNSAGIERPNPFRTDPRAVARADPRLGQNLNHSQQNEPPRQQSHSAAKPNEQEVRLAFKYNPHPRREAPPTKSDFDQQGHGMPRADEHRSLNHLPSLNPSDPRLRNRQLPLFPPESALPNQIGGMPSPIANISSPMSPMTNFLDSKLNHPMAESLNSPNCGPPQTFFGKFQPSSPMPQPLMQNMFMNSNTSRFNQPQPQPRTYGEYRKIRQSIEKTKKQPVAKKVETPQLGMNHSPLEATVKPMEFTASSTAPSVLDNMYRNTDFKKDSASSSGVQSFKIPKIRKEPPEKTNIAPPAKDEVRGNKQSSKDNKIINQGKKDKTQNGKDKLIPQKSDKSSKDNDKTANNKEKNTALTNVCDEENWDDDESTPITKNTVTQKKRNPFKNVISDSESNDSDGLEAVSDQWDGENDDSNSSSVPVVEETSASKKASSAKAATKAPTSANTKSKDKKDEQSPQAEPISVDDSESNESLKLVSKTKSKKRKSTTAADKTGVKIRKTSSTADDDENDKNVEETVVEKPAESKKSADNTDGSQSTSKPSTSNPAPDNEDEDEDDEPLPDTIINSDISSKNIIEGKRRTRGANRLSEVFEVATNRPKQSSVSPVKKGKAPGTPSNEKTPEKNENTEGVESVEDSSQECAVSSTTSAADPEPMETETKPKTEPKDKKVATVPKPSPAKEETTEEAEKPAPASQSSTNTGGAQKDEITKEWLEGFLLNLFNPSSMSTNSVLVMLEKVLDSNKFDQVKKILCAEEAKPKNEELSTSETRTTEEEPVQTVLSVPAVKDNSKNKPKKKKNELDRLNEDIRDMFICEGVLTATGRRMCSVIGEKDKFEEIDQTAHSSKHVEMPVLEPAIIKPAPKPKAKVPAQKGAQKRKLRRGGVFWRGDRKKKGRRGRPRKKPVDENSEYGDETFDEMHDEEMEIASEQNESRKDDDMQLAQCSDANQPTGQNSDAEEEVLKIVIGGKKGTAVGKDNDESVEILDSSNDDMDDDESIKVQNTSSPAKNKSSSLNQVVTVKNAANLTPDLMPIVLLKRGRGRPPKPKTPEKELKNTNPDMHVQSEFASQCALCSARPRCITKHYLLQHHSEVMISRLPPHNQAQIMNGQGIRIKGVVKRSQNQIGYTALCPFCDVQHAFSKLGWMDHFATHTGEYTFQCSKCGDMLNNKSDIRKHIKKKCPKAEANRIRAVTGMSKFVNGYICNLCNYIQLTNKKVVSHLLNEHGCSDDKNLTKIILLKCDELEFKDPEYTLPSTASEPPAKQPRLDLDVGEDDAIVSEQNRDVFVTNEQNDINLDTNIIQFMRDVSFNATGSPPRQSTMSVADRITERLKNANTNPINEQEVTSVKPQSITDRLTERFNRVSNEAEAKNRKSAEAADRSTGNESSGPAKELPNSAVAADQHSEPATSAKTTPEPLTEKLSSPAKEIDISSTNKDVTNEVIADANESLLKTHTPIANSAECASTGDENTQLSEDDVIIISDGEEEAKLTSDAKSNSPNSCSKLNTSDQLGKQNDGSEILDDDDDWEDIEAPPSPSCLDNESKGSTSDCKGKKNKTIYATLSRLYASIVQPKAKGKADGTSDPSDKKSETDKNTNCNVNLKKAESPGMNRVNKIGFSEKNPGTLKYHCLVDDCSFLYSDIPEGLESHVVFEHSAVTWDGFCHMCGEKVTANDGLKLVDELRHMQETHINKPKAAAAQPKAATEPSGNFVISSGILKIRRLSGDVLSGQTSVATTKPTSPPPLQITSAVSLNKDSDIWKPFTVNQAPEKPKKQNMPFVIKQVTGAGSPSIVIQPTTKTSPTQGSLKISKVTSISGMNMFPESNAVSSSTASAPSCSDAKQAKDAANSSSLTLRPWIPSSTGKKSAEVAKILTQEINLYALYKCMGDDCPYVTNSIELFAKHLNNHELAAMKSASSAERPWRQCCYCQVNLVNPGLVARHIITKHARDIYQCAHCFYRSREQYNVEVHQRAHHPGKEEKVLAYPPPKNLTVEIQSDILKHLKANIIKFVDVIKCAECARVWISPDVFSVHIQEQHDPSTEFLCTLCSSKGFYKDYALAHLKNVHDIHYFQCIYCRHGTDNQSVIETHLANCHPSEISFCCIRTTGTTENIPGKIFAKTALGATIVRLSTPNSQKLKRCPYSEAELNSLGWDITLFLDTPKLERQSDPNCKILPPDTIITSYPSNTPPTTLAATDKMDGMSDHSSKVLAAALELVQHTGPETLFICGYPGCDKKFGANIKLFRTHLGQVCHDYLPCHYCGKTFASINEYTLHYLQHERHRYFCFLCFETDRATSALARHIHQKHPIKGKVTIVTYALIKGCINPRKDFFFVCPNNVKSGDVLRFGDRLLKVAERKKWAQMKKAFTPEEMDQLPRQAIFLEELYCAVCQYKTKVRTNLYRHLQFHKNEVIVANVDPVNPVPCLNSNEKHFDKMTNLACSSHPNKPPPPATNGPGTSGATPLLPVKKDGVEIEALGTKSSPILPRYIPATARFACGVKSCQHLSLDENSLKQHLNSDHRDDKSYRCPHCKRIICANKISTDHVIQHLKFHDAKQFRCVRCSFIHFDKSTMENHLIDKHFSNSQGYYTYIRSENDGEKTVIEESTAPAFEAAKVAMYATNWKWVCMLCKQKTATQSQMTAHINTSHGIKYRYQCSKCKFGGVLISSISDHAQRKHPHDTPEVLCYYSKLDEDAASQIDTTPLWRRDPNKVKNIRGILMEEEPLSPKSSAISLPIALDDSIDEAECISEAEEDIATPNPEEKGDVTEINSGVRENELPENTKQLVLTSESRVCHICAYVGSDESSLEFHIAEAHCTNKAGNFELLNQLFKYTCFYCRSSFKSIELYSQHWQQTHKFISSGMGKIQDKSIGVMPWFTVLKRLRCARCSMTNDYRELAIHHFIEHPQDNFAVCCLENKKQCGHCAFVYESNCSELFEHYKTEHPPKPETADRSPIPPDPTLLITQNQLQGLIGLGEPLQSFKCTICHMVMSDMQSSNHHFAEVHEIVNNQPCAITQGILYKCPTCHFCSPMEIMIVRHISNKLNSNNFVLHKTMTRLTQISENVWPFMTMEVIFPNGLILPKYSLLATQYGKLNCIENFLKKATSSPGTASAPATKSDSIGANESSENSLDDDGSAGRKAKPVNAKRRLIRKPSTKSANTDGSASDEDYVPPGAKRRQKTTASSAGHTVVANAKKTEPTTMKPAPAPVPAPSDDQQGSVSCSNLEAAEEKNTESPKPFSSYGTKAASVDGIVANVHVDGVSKVDVPAGAGSVSSIVEDAPKPMDIGEPSAGSVESDSKTS